MIAKAKAISHGINGINYITGESRNKKNPEKINFICDNLLAPGLAPTGIWNAMKMTSMSHPKVVNNVIRIELSPAKENTENFTLEDWKNLWHDFVREFDSQELKDKKGNILSPKTNIADSKYTVWLHENSKSGIPHLHAAVCRIDDNGNINNDSNIHLRAQRAAEKVAMKYGWETAREIHNIRGEKVEKDCREILKNMASFSFAEYFSGLESKGYDVRVRKSDDGKVYGYILEKDGCRYKASEIGKGRHFTASRIEETWKEEHRQLKYKPSEDKDSDSITITDEMGRQFEIPDYTKKRNNTRKVEIVRDNTTIIRYIPEAVMRFFDSEFDSRKFSNGQELKNESCYHFSVAQGFLAMMNTPSFNSGGGGGSTDNDLKRSRDELEEEMKWATRCANFVKSKIGVVRKPKFKR